MSSTSSSIVSTSSLSWALQRLARSQGARLDDVGIQASVNGLDQSDAVAALALVCERLALPAPQRLATPDPVMLALLCHTSAGWGVVLDREADGSWRVAYETGEARAEPDALDAACFHLLLASLPEQGGAVPADGAPQEFRLQLRAALRLHRGSLIDACLASGFVGLLALATSLFSMQVYDRVIPTRGEATLLVLAAGVFISVMIELAMKLARAHLMDHVAVGVDTRLSREVFQRLLSLRVDQLPASVGSLASQIRGYEQVRSFYTASTLFALIDLPLAAVFVVIVMFLATPEVALLLVGFGIVAALLGLVTRRAVMRLAKEGAAFSNMKTGLLVEAVEGVETIKAGAGHWKFLARWVAVNQQSILSDLKLRHASERMGHLGGSIQQLSYASLIVAGALLVMQGHMTTGALIACSILSGRILSPILALPGLFVQHAHARAAQDSLEKLYKLQVDNQGVSRPLVPEKIRGGFEIRDAEFAYGDNPPAIKLKSLRIQAGERIAILGPIGAGKSTLLRLISGLYVPQSGRILLDGLDLSHISRQVVSREVGYLQQDHRLFQGTLRENLLIGLPDPGDEALLQAMRRTGMDAFVAAHPKGLDRMISEGGKGLSGGQRQLLAFTRLVLCNPRVLLLDEPTASMDDEQERRCLAALAEEADAGKTLVIVTHKRSVLPLVNRVIVVTAAGVIMDGPRDAVLRQLAGQPSAGAPAGPAPGATPDPSTPQRQLAVAGA